MEPWQRWLLLLRMAVMNIALSIMFYSFRHMPLGMYAYVVKFLNMQHVQYCTPW